MIGRALVHFTARAGRGCWGVALLAAVLVPAFVEAANAHRGHWAVTGDLWADLALPGAARIWALVLGVALAGWAAGAGPAEPRFARRLLGGGLAGLLGLGVAAVAAVPAWVWLMRLGVASPTRLAALAGLALVAPAGAALVAGASGAWLGESAGVALGAAAGALLLWATWGGFA